MAKSPEAAALATFWHSVESPLRLLGSSAGLFVIPASHACFAAVAAAEFVLPPPELELGVEVLLLPPEPELGADLLLLLPQPVTTTLPATTSTNKIMTFVLMCESLLSKSKPRDRNVPDVPPTTRLAREHIAGQAASHL
ncbi:MAG: hypothetical protein ACYDHH_12295 [Solirubrobacteraceae bacterium]